jgi:acetyl esterase
MRQIRQPQFGQEAERFLSGAEVQEGPIAYDDLLQAREDRPDPDLVGSPEPVRVRTDVLLPLPCRAIRVRLYRNLPAAPRPLLLWLHGGAFIGGTLDDLDVVCAGLARRTGLTVLSLDYGLAPEHPFPAALEDTYDTLTWLERHGEAFAGDGRVVAGGQSAGANLAAAACLVARDRGGPQVTRQVLCYPWLDFGADSESHRRFDGIDGVAPSRHAWYLSQYLAGQAVTPYAAPLLAQDLSGLPPALILGAGMDPLRDDARRYADRLQHDGVDASYLEYDDTPHAFLNFPGALSAAWTAMQDIAHDLASLLASEHPAASVRPEMERPAVDPDPSPGTG